MPVLPEALAARCSPVPSASHGPSCRSARENCKPICTGAAQGDDRSDDIDKFEANAISERERMTLTKFP
jgi:hypothetical protein